MRYKVSNYFVQERNKILLVTNKWDDYGFKTTFDMQYIDESGKDIYIGTIKIARTNMDDQENITASFIPKEFDSLPNEFYSILDSAETYKKVRELFGVCVFEDLNDVAYDLKKMKIHDKESVFQNSLFRSCSVHTCVNQFNRIAHGEAMLTKYSFEYMIKRENEFLDDLKLSFEVNPKSYPPTNVHALIGGNGTGKTTLIKNMIKSIFREKAIGSFEYGDFLDRDNYGYFEGVMCISFSPFDDYSEIEKYKNIKFIGVKKEYANGGSLLESIRDDFVISYENCMDSTLRKNDMKELLDYLIEVGELSGQIKNIKDILDRKIECAEKLVSEEKELIKNEFDKMSAGHKVILSILVRCIDKLAEKTIVFIDEPENHLHPPLLSTLIRCLSGLLTKRNGVAVISTHSPIVLQEIPKSCVWYLYRNGDILFAERVEGETFGTNIGVLMNNIFGFQISKTGFNEYLKEAVNDYNTYDEVLSLFNEQLGDQAKSMVRVLLSRKDKEN